MKTGKILQNESAGVNQILPHVNKWAWDLYAQVKTTTGHRKRFP